ncbi:MAG: alpha/beta fold hydrolase [Myxococcota bacterium]|nr:alpha/beta fold hydrolase [Myxococcota bacterium]
MTRRVAVAGGELAYVEAGAGDRPLVLLHGYTGSKRDFRERLPELAALGRCLAPDLRGHGESSRSETYSLEALSDDLIGLLDGLGVERCDLLGHSMGGMVGLRALLSEPQRFASLILMNTTPRPIEGVPVELFEVAWRVAREAGMSALLQILRVRSRNDPTRTAADRRLEAEWGEGYWSDWRIPNSLAMDPEAYAALGRAMLEQEQLTPRLAEIRCPNLVMVGESDRSFLDAADVLEREIPGARRVTISDAGHQPQLEAPVAWLDAVRGHLQAARRASQPDDGPAQPGGLAVRR